MDKMMKIREYISELTLQKVRDLPPKELMSFNTTHIMADSIDKKYLQGAHLRDVPMAVVRFLQLFNNGNCAEWCGYQRSENQKIAMYTFY